MSLENSDQTLDSPVDTGKPDVPDKPREPGVVQTELMIDTAHTATDSDQEGLVVTRRKSRARKKILGSIGGVLAVIIIVIIILGIRFGWIFAKVASKY